MAGGAILSLESNNIPTRDARRAQTKPCVHRPHGPHKWLSQTYIQVSEHPLWRHGSSVACPWDRGSGCSGPERCSVWAPPYSHWADKSQTEKQWHQRCSCTVAKVPGPTTDFPTWGSGTGTENLQGTWLWKLVQFSSVQSLSHVQLFATPWTTAR